MTLLGADNFLTKPEDIEKNHAGRVKNGFGEADWWNFDSYIGRVIANATLKFATEGHGWFPLWDEKQAEDFPYDYPEGTYENFVATCGAIYFALTEWLDGEDFGDGWETRYDEAREAMILWAEHLGAWWD